MSLIVVCIHNIDASGDEPDLNAAPSRIEPAAPDYDAERDAGLASTRIFIRRGGPFESWLTTYPNGHIEHHVENADEPRDQWIDLDHVRNYWPEILPQVEAALAELSGAEEQ
jgi:hypothetical protein